jgi:hypothetical protein
MRVRRTSPPAAQRLQPDSVHPGPNGMMADFLTEPDELQVQHSAMGDSHCLSVFGCDCPLVAAHSPLIYPEYISVHKLFTHARTAAALLVTSQCRKQTAQRTARTGSASLQVGGAFPPGLHEAQRLGGASGRARRLPDNRRRIFPEARSESDIVPKPARAYHIRDDTAVLCRCLLSLLLFA